MTSSVGLMEIFLALVVVICFFFIILGKLGKNKDELPTTWPVVGMLPALLPQVYPDNNLYEWTTKLLLKSQCNFLFQGPWFSNMKILFTADPANVQYILCSNFNNFHKGPDFKSTFDVLGDGIFNSDSDQWRDQRKTAVSLLTHRHFQKFLARTTTNIVHNHLFSILNEASENRSTVDLQATFYRFTFESTCMLVGGLDPDCLSIDFPDVSFDAEMDDAQRAVFYRHILPKFFWKLQRYLGVGDEKKLSRAKKNADHILKMYINEKKEKMMNDDNEEGTDLLTSYLNLGYENNSYLKDMMLNFVLAGRDSVALTLTWLFWNFSQHSSVVKKIREEISSVNQDSDNFFNKLVYLHAALSESLRLYPVVPINSKYAIKPDILPSGHHVNSSIQIILNTYAMGRIPSIWGDDCLEFRPERWITDKGELKHVPAHKFHAFNAGPRICPGKDMSFTQMKIIMVNIIQKFDIQVVEDQDVNPGFGISLIMKNGLKVKVNKRT